MKQHGDENALTGILKKPDDDEPKCNGAERLPDNPIGAAAHLIIWDDMPERPNDTENGCGAKDGGAIS